MNEHDVIRHMGRFPDRIGAKMLTSKKWTCSKCKKETTFKEEVEPPAPCSCGSIFFEKGR